jgi:hypothetical protein
VKKLLDWWRRTGRKRFSAIPLMGPLVYCTTKDHMQTLKEMFVVLVFATVTFWLTSALLMGWGTTRALGYEAVLRSTMASGELFIFSVGLLGPILLLAGEDKQGGQPFPGRLWHLFFLLIIGLVATGFHSQIKYAQLLGKPSEQDLEFWFEVSQYLAIGAVTLRYLATLYRKSTFEPEAEIKEPEVDFVKSYEEHVKNESVK